MGSIGEDIKSTLEEVGGAYTIIRDAGNISGEYCDYDLTSQATKPLTIEAFRRAMVSYDSETVVGDVIEFDTTAERYMVMNKLPEIFENDVIQYESIFYLCNISSGELLRPSGETWGVDYHKETEWEVIKNNCDAMQVAALYGNSLEDDEDLAMIGLAKNEVLLPSSVGAQVLDRF